MRKGQRKIPRNWKTVIRELPIAAPGLILPAGVNPEGLRQVACEVGVKLKRRTMPDGRTFIWRIE